MLAACRSRIAVLQQACRSQGGARAGFSALSTEVATGINYLKEGADPPLLPDEEYPEWLFALTEPLPALTALRKKLGKGSLLAGDVTMAEAERILKLENRAKIKEANELRAK